MFVECVLCAGHFAETLTCDVSLTLTAAWELELLPGLPRRPPDPKNPALSSEAHTCRDVAFGVEGRQG